MVEKNANWFEICQNKQIALAMTFRNDSFAWVQGVTNTKKLSKQFEMGREESWNFKYCGFRIFQSKDTFEIKISQDEFAEEVEVPRLSPSRSKEPEADLTKAEQSCLRGIAGKIGWLARGTRPDLLFPQLEASTKLKAAHVLTIRYRCLKSAG